MLSLGCKAAIKAVIFLGAKLPESERRGLREVAAYIGENEHTVGKLLQRLARAGIIHSAKGPNGGFYITPAQGRLRLVDIVEAIDGSGVFTQCGLGLSKCSASRPCPVHYDFSHVRSAFEKMCRQKRISDLYEGVKRGEAYLLG